MTDTDLHELAQALQEARSDRERLTRAGEALLELRLAVGPCQLPDHKPHRERLYRATAAADAVAADLARSVSEAALGRVGERIRELERLVAKSAENADVRADAETEARLTRISAALALAAADLPCSNGCGCEPFDYCAQDMARHALGDVHALEASPADLDSSSVESANKNEVESQAGGS